MKSIIDMIEGRLDKKLITLAVTCLLLLSGMMVIFSDAGEAASPENEVDVEDETNAVKGSKERDTSKVETSANEIKADGGSEWLIESVETDGDVGIGSSMAVDSSGNPHIAYWAYYDQDLRYARWDGSSWYKRTVNIDVPYNPRTSLVIDSDDNPHIAYVKGFQLRYGWYDSDYNWHGTTVVDGNNYEVEDDISLGLDSDGDPHIAYFESSNDAIRYAHRDDGGNWYKNDWIWGKCSYGDLSLAMDPNDFPDISVYDTEDDYLLYLDGYGYKSDNEYTLEYHKTYVDLAGDVGRHNSIAIDSEGYPTISYYDKTNGDLKLASQGASGDWSTIHSDWEGDVGSYTSLVLDDTGDPHVSYTNNENSSLKYGRKETFFGKETVDDSTEMMHTTSIDLGKNGHPRIAYYDYKNADLKYAVEGIPSKPEFLWVAGGDDKVDLWWGEPEDPGGRDIDKYNIYRGETSGGESLLTSVDSTSTTYTDNDVTPGNKYYYYVTAENPIGESPESMEGNATPSTDNQPPSKPKVSYPEDGDFLEEGQTSTALMVDVRDPDGDSMDVKFKDFFGNTIGTDSVEGEGTASTLYDNLIANMTYSWYAIADDGINTTTSDWFYFTTDDPYEIDKDNDGPNSAYDIGNNEEKWLSDLEGKGRQADQDWYEIDVTQDYQYVHAKATFTHADGDIELRLYNSSGLPVALSDTWTDDEYIHYKVKSSGTHYLRVSGQHKGNLYDLWWDDKETPLPPEDPKPADGSRA
ncbi:MAG: fibronectin type III domain-containing protein, partial [Candidatus Thermoplasmatota archaeon]